MIYSLETCIFQRKCGGTKEVGLLINENALIIDGNLKPVTDLWNYDKIPGVALFDLKIGGEYPKKGE